MTNHYSQTSCIMRFTRLLATLCATLFTLTACLEDHLSDIPKAEHRLTIAAAKTFFEASVATTRTTFADDPGITSGELCGKIIHNCCLYIIRGYECAGYEYP